MPDRVPFSEDGFCDRTYILLEKVVYLHGFPAHMHGLFCTGCRTLLILRPLLPRASVLNLGWPVVLMALTSPSWVISLGCLDVVSLARQISMHLLNVSLLSARSFFRVVLSLIPTTTLSLIIRSCIVPKLHVLANERTDQCKK